MQTFVGMTVYSYPLRFLVADDSPLNLLVAVESLALYFPQATVEEVASGEDVLKLVEHQAFDLLLLDVHMPGLSGFDVARTLRSSFEGSKQHTPIIALTGSDAPEIVDEALESGMNVYLCKPVEPVKLAKVIAGLLELPPLTHPDFSTPPLRPDHHANEHFDASFLRAFCHDDDAQIRFFLQQFSLHWEQEFEKMVRAVREGDRDGLRRAAHSFWPQLEFVGLKKAASIDDALETEAKQAFRPDVLNQLLASLKNDIEMGLLGLKQAFK
jgi:CheY-like chemotaxis protein/HPt (histidine-containing phosphotransfer) domain-containing protein